MGYTVFAILLTTALLPALATVFIPFFPTFWYLASVAVAFVAIDGFVHLTAWNLLTLAGIVLASVVVDFGSGLLGARFGGAGWKSVFYGALGATIGLIIFPPLGAVVGFMTLIFLSELIRSRRILVATRGTAGAFLGVATGAMLNFFLVLAFVVFFILFALL